MNVEADYYHDGVSLKLSLSEDEKSIWITMSKISVIELSICVPLDELKLAIRKLTAK